MTATNPIPESLDGEIITTARNVNRIKRDSMWDGPNYYLPIPGQLKVLGLGEFEGRQHSGLDVSLVPADSRRCHVAF